VRREESDRNYVSASILVGLSIIFRSNFLNALYDRFTKSCSVTTTPEMTKKTNEELNPFEEPKRTTRVVKNQSNLTETTHYHLE